MAVRRSGRSFKTVLGHHIDADHTNHSTAFFDILNYRRVMIVMHVGAITTNLNGNNRLDFVLEGADDSRGTGTGRVPSGDIINGVRNAQGVCYRINSAHTEASSHICSYIGPERYIRVFSNFVGTVSEDFPFGVVVIGFDRLLPDEDDIDTG